MESIVYLDPDDEVASIRSKLSAVRDSQAAVVVPFENRTLHSSVAIRLVARHADDRALRLAVVSGDATVRRLAREEGLKVFRNVKGYRSYVIRQSRPLGRFGLAMATFGLPIGRAVPLALLLAVLLLAGGGAYAVIPVATITLQPVSEPIADAVVIKADPAAKSINYEARQIPARAALIPIDSSIQVPTTGRRLTPNAPAEGQVTFTNRTGGSVKIPIGTIVKTLDNVRFSTSQEVSLPPSVGATARADIVSLEPGDKGNVDRGKISKVEGTLETQVVVFNEEPTAGGGAREVPVVVAADRDKAKASLLEKMNKEALAKLSAERKEDDSLPPHSISFTILDEVFDKREGDQAKVLNLKITARASGTIFDGRDVNNLLARVWQPSTRSGFTVPPNAYKLAPPEIVKVDNGTVTFVVKVTGVAVARVNEGRVVENVRWMSVREIREYLAGTLNLAKEPLVNIQPEWATRALRIRVMVEGDWLKN